MKANDIMEVRLYKPENKFLEYLSQQGKIVGQDGDFKRKINVFDLFGYHITGIQIYFKDTKEVIYLDDIVAEEIPIDNLSNIIIFELFPSTAMQEEIDNCGFEDFFEDLLLVWEKHFFEEMNVKIEKNLLAYIGNTLPSQHFFTAWKWWSYTSDSISCGPEYEYGCDYVGIIDMVDLKVL